jgi:predicted PurR-regulated permease PerM
MMYISLSYIYMVIAAFIISLALEWCIVFWQRLTKNRWAWILITYLIATLFVLAWFVILIPFFFNRGTQLLQ